MIGIASGSSVDHVYDMGVTYSYAVELRTGSQFDPSVIIPSGWLKTQIQMKKNGVRESSRNLCNAFTSEFSSLLPPPRMLNAPKNKL